MTERGLYVEGNMLKSQNKTAGKKEGNMCAALVEIATKRTQQEEVGCTGSPRLWQMQSKTRGERQS